MSEIAAIVLAAGSASRYRAAGGLEPSKLVAPFHGEPLVRAAVKAALAAKLSGVVVTGHARDEVEAALAGLEITLAHNADFPSGLASSLKVGVAALPAGASGALVLLGDMPRVSPHVLSRLANAFAARPDALAVIPVFAGQRGNPVLLARALFAEVAKLQGDAGARRLLQAADAARVVEVEFGDEAVTLDVDTPEDLARAEPSPQGALRDPLVMSPP
jgi:molybdenum cofactor cytidylyltransferase